MHKTETEIQNERNNGMEDGNKEGRAETGDKTT
jgi:hypothetical protein